MLDEKTKQRLLSLRNDGCTIKEIALDLGVSASTVSRYVYQMGLAVSKQDAALQAVSRRRLTQEQFVERSKAVHGDTYDYSKVHYVNNSTKVEIICPVHGSFWQTPNKHMSGRGCTHPNCIQFRKQQTCQDHYGVDNPMKSDEVKERVMQTLLDRYGVTNVMQNEDVKQKLQDCLKEKYGCICTLQLDSVKKKSYETKLQKGSLLVSPEEDCLYDLLCSHFGDSDVEQQYRSDVYPYSCDFHIKSRDLYIELNLIWTHGGHWFDDSNPSDSEQLALWKQKACDSDYYQNAVYVWTELDLRKRNFAKVHGLNYIVFWEHDLSDARLWLSLGCPDGQDWKGMYSWLPDRSVL